MAQEKDLSKLQAGDPHYKAFVGPPLKYDLVGALQFNLLTAAGLRAHHKLCDIGCGSLRGGKMLIPYLNNAHYFGLEPNEWLVEEGIKNELGQDLLELKKPQFTYNPKFDLSTFNTQFDYLIAQSIFSHASAGQIGQCLRSAKAFMHSQSLFLATFVEGAEDYQGSEWVYPGCVEYKPASIKAMAQKEGLCALKTDWPHPNGQSWYLICRPEYEAKAREKAQYNLKIFEFTAPKKPPQPGFWEKVRYNLKLMFKG